MAVTPEFSHLHVGITHDLREALTLSKGWLEAVLKSWKTLDDHEREAMVTAALFGTNRIGFILDLIEGASEEELEPAPDRTADDLERISERTSSIPVNRRLL
jgi:hypothetical protein